MTRLSPRSSAYLLVLALVALAAWAAYDARRSGEGIGVAVARADEPAAQLVSVEMTVRDSASGLEVTVKRKVATGSTALELMRSTLALETKEYPDLGVFVTKLCGIAPPPGKFWSPEVDGKKSAVGVARIQFDRDTRLDWQLRDAKAE
jgi:hypothetical protein